MNDGLRACEEALTRLMKGEPVVSKHVGLSLKKITASIVSLEAGFDRGYLKNPADYICLFWRRLSHAVMMKTRDMEKPAGISRSTI